MLQYNEELDVPVEYLTFLRFNNKELQEQNIKTDPLYHEAQLLVSQGKTEQALALIRTETEGKFDNPDLALLFMKILDLQEENDKLRWIGGPIIDLLISSGRQKDSIYVYRKCFRDTPVVFPKANALSSLYGWFLKGKRFKEAAHCAELLIEKYPDDHRAPNLHLASASLALTHFKDRKKAGTLIQRYLKQYPEHKRRTEAEKMAHWLNRTTKHRV